MDDDQILDLRNRVANARAFNAPEYLIEVVDQLLELVIEQQRQLDHLLPKQPLD